MKITQQQYEEISGIFPRQRGNVTIDNLTMLHVLEHWERVSKQFRQLAQHLHLHEPLERIFARLQQEQMFRINANAFSLDSTVSKVHPDGTGALKKWPSVSRQILGRMDNKTASASAECAVLLIRIRS